MSKKHIIVILSDTRFGCEPGFYIDGLHGSMTEGMLGNDLRHLQPFVKRGFLLQYGDGWPESIGHWPDDLKDVQNLELSGVPS